LQTSIYIIVEERVERPLPLQDEILGAKNPPTI